MYFPEVYKRTHVPQHPGKPADEELVKYPSVHLTSIHEWGPSVLDYSILNVMGNQSGLLIYNILIFLILILIPMGCIPRGLSIPCPPRLMHSNHLPWLCLHPCQLLKPTSTMSSQKHLIMTNAVHTLVG